MTIRGRHKGPKEVHCLVTFRDGKQRGVYYRTRAGRIVDPGWRASFLHQVRENARTLELAEAWIPE